MLIFMQKGTQKIGINISLLSFKMTHRTTAYLHQRHILFLEKDNLEDSFNLLPSFPSHHQHPPCATLYLNGL